MGKRAAAPLEERNNQFGTYCNAIIDCNDVTPILSFRQDSSSSRSLECHTDVIPQKGDEQGRRGREDWEGRGGRQAREDEVIGQEIDTQTYRYSN